MYAIVDVETTGVSYKYGKLTEIVVYLHNGMEITGSFQTLLNPEMDIPCFITRLTGIDNKMIAGAPRFYEVAKKLCTVKLSRELLPGHRSYSLGNLYKYPDIVIRNRHRAGGDALATVKLFEILPAEHRLKSRSAIPGHFRLFQDPLL